MAKIKQGKDHPKTDVVIVEFANGETERIKCSSFVANCIFDASFTRGHSRVTIVSSINGELWQVSNNGDKPSDCKWTKAGDITGKGKW